MKGGKDANLANSILRFYRPNQKKLEPVITNLSGYPTNKRVPRNKSGDSFTYSKTDKNSIR